MADTAAHLVDRVFPEVPVRQWVLSVPYALRYSLAYDSSPVTDAIKDSVDIQKDSVDIHIKSVGAWIWIVRTPT